VLITSTTSAPTAPEVRSSEPKYNDIVDPYPTMMDDHKKVIDDNLLTAVNMIVACFDKLEGETTDGNASGVDSSSKQPEFGMPLNFMIIKVYMQQQIKANQSLRQLKSIRPV
jgi:hypothetical protein